MKYTLELNGHVLPSDMYSVSAGEIKLNVPLLSGQILTLYTCDDDDTPISCDTYVTRETEQRASLLWDNHDHTKFTEAQRVALKGFLPRSLQ